MDLEVHNSMENFLIHLQWQEAEMMWYCQTYSEHVITSLSPFHNHKLHS